MDITPRSEQPITEVSQETATSVPQATPLTSDQDEAEVAGEFRIEQLFGSRTRARLLGLFLENSDRAFYVRELARRIDAQLNSVRRELKNLLDIGIVLEIEGADVPVLEKDEDDEGGRLDNKRFYQANKKFPIFEDLHAVMKKVAVLMNHTLMKELSRYGTLNVLILTGSFTDAHTIPTDILVVGELREEGVQTAISEFEKEIGREINYTFMPLEEFEYRRDVGDRFLLGILQGKHLVLADTTGKV